jgi:hypothetical protein
METKSAAKDVGGFLEWVQTAREEFGFGRSDATKSDPWQPWYRGHVREEWPLLPKLYRQNSADHHRHRTKVEDEIVEEFCVRAPALFEQVPAKDDPWSWWFLMQHYGVPTRLLDWTEAPLLALFFAVRDDSARFHDPVCCHADAAVWALDPYALNRKTLRIHVDCVPSPCVPCAERGKDSSMIDGIMPRLPFRFGGAGTNRPHGVVAVNPSHTVRRISSQRSGFTVHASDCEDLMKYEGLKFNNRAYLCRYIIPFKRVEPIRKELEDYGIDETTVFPDLAGLGNALESKWRKALAL